MNIETMDKTLVDAKRFDLQGQILAVLIPLGIAAGNGSNPVWILVTLGLWQLISFLIHLSIGTQAWKRPARKKYGRTLAVLAGLGILSCTGTGAVFPFLTTMFVAGIALGIWYFRISFAEFIEVRG